MSQSVRTSKCRTEDEISDMMPGGEKEMVK